MEQIIIFAMLFLSFIAGNNFCKSIKNAEIENKDREIKDLKFWETYWKSKFQDTQIPDEILYQAEEYRDMLYEKWKQSHHPLDNSEVYTEQEILKVLEYEKTELTDKIILKLKELKS